MRAQMGDHALTGDQGRQQCGSHHRCRPGFGPPHSSRGQGIHNRPGRRRRRRGLTCPFGEAPLGTACAACEYVNSSHKGNAWPQGKFKLEPRAILKGLHAEHRRASLPPRTNAACLNCCPSNRC
jgi:hypothetical protein